ncbi:Hypothetical predicted protein [Prunus dulcis]|uniref:Uncharacterized protein n=1 Tax=Prunus dulcis TaxID=3755 RepID=A0A5E4FPM4_PRUDU|nr:hypothetical protein L3X38_036961 [Prunus dulcis]VVA29429.1 Hypothetical predicted protein [Prunus dulcis]
MTTVPAQSGVFGRSHEICKNLGSNGPKHSARNEWTKAHEPSAQFKNNKGPKPRDWEFDQSLPMPCGTITSLRKISDIHVGTAPFAPQTVRVAKGSVLEARHLLCSALHHTHLVSQFSVRPRLKWNRVLRSKPRSFTNKRMPRAKFCTAQGQNLRISIPKDANQHVWNFATGQDPRLSSMS